MDTLYAYLDLLKLIPTVVVEIFHSSLICTLGKGKLTHADLLILDANTHQLTDCYTTVVVIWYTTGIVIPIPNTSTRTCTLVTRISTARRRSEPQKLRSRVSSKLSV